MDTYFIHNTSCELVIRLTCMTDDHWVRRSIFEVVPNELLERILIFCHPLDVVAFSKTCRPAHSLVYHSGDQYLWRELFLFHPFDDPRQFPYISQPKPFFTEWQHELTQRMEAEQLLLNPQTPLYQKSRALQTLISVVHQAPPINQTHLTVPSDDLIWVDQLLRRSRTLYSMPDACKPAYAMIYARLRSYTALSLDDYGVDQTVAHRRARRNASRSFVYDLRNYTSDNNWGPYLDNGSINWIHIDNLVNVMVMNIRDLPHPWMHITPPIGLDATRPYSAPRTSPTSRDWAGVEGTWRRYVCFMDYRDLFAFNYSDPPQGVPSRSFFEEPRFREATRLIELKLHIVGQEHPRFRRRPKPTNIACDVDRYPPLYFSGSSKGVNGNEASVEGIVHMNQDGIPRWQFSSVYAGNAQWSSDGVQVGNIASGLGIVGVWTTSFHDQGDPVGPFWLWKVKDEYPVHLMEYI